MGRRGETGGGESHGLSYGCVRLRLGAGRCREVQGGAGRCREVEGGANALLPGMRVIKQKTNTKRLCKEFGCGGEERDGCGPSFALFGGGNYNCLS